MRDAMEIMVGMLQFNSISIYKIFDMGVKHIFVVYRIVNKLNLKKKKLNRRVTISTPLGKKV